MTLTLLGVLALVITAVVGCVAAMAGQLYERRKWERRLLDSLPSLDSPVPDNAERMERLERALDVIAVELERVGEGQRFVTRLLSNRAPCDTAMSVAGRAASRELPDSQKASTKIHQSSFA